MQDESLKRAVGRPYTSEHTFESEAVYEGTRIPLPGLTTVRVVPGRITAKLRNRTGWEAQMYQTLPKGTVLFGGELFRPAAPGRLIRPEHYGTITAGAGWIAHRALWVGQSGAAEPTFTFQSYDLEVPGPAAKSPVVGQRNIYRRASFYRVAEVEGSRIVASPLSENEASIDEELMGVTFETMPDEVDEEAVWHTLNLLAGNTLEPLASESLADNGEIVKTHYRPGVGKDTRREFFHKIFPGYGCLAPDGFATIFTGIRRLLKADFPIHVILHHLHAAAGQPYDIEAQQLVLGIHTAIEAWNRHFGREEWLDSDAWDPLAKKFRKPMKQLEEYQTLSAEMKANIASAMAHANDTTTAWRQDQFFKALDIDVSDEHNARALKLRNALLHDGYFRPRYDELSHESKEQRMHDIERLRRLILLMVFKLTGYTGDFTSPMTFMAEHVDCASVARVATDDFWAKPAVPPRDP